MLAALFGDPSPRSVFAISALRALVNLSVGVHDWVSAGTERDVAAALNERKHKHLLLHSDCPKTSLSLLYKQSELPIFVFLDDFETVVAALMIDRKANFSSALRTATLIFACLHDLAVDPNSKLMHFASSDVNTRDLLSYFADAIGLDVSEEVLLKVLDRVAGREQTMRSACTAVAETRGKLADLGSPFIQLRERRSVDTLVWDRTLFLNADAKGTPLTGSMDLTGPARIVIHGPYLNLPPGHWVACFLFEISGNLSGNILRVDVSSSGILAEGTCVLPANGSFWSEMAFEITEARRPIEIRFATGEGAIEGSFDLKSVELRRR